jgi:hypothetical protein
VVSVQNGNRCVTWEYNSGARRPFIRITAMIGTGLIATPIANVSISLIP